MPSLKNPAVRGTLWTLLDYGVGNVLRFGSNLILTRLLVPEYFGLMAFVSTINLGLELLSDLGIEQGIIQNKRGDEAAFLNTAWTLKIIRGALLWLVCLIIILPVAYYYQDDRLKLLIPLTGLNSILGGLSSTYMTTLNRHMSLGITTAINLAVQVVSIAGMATWAYFDPSIWALGIGGMIGPVFKLVLTHVLHRLHHKTNNRLDWDVQSALEIFHFGKSLFFATALMFLAEQVDRFILAKLISFKMLGVYTIAFTLATLPREVLKNLCYRVLFPIIARSVEIPRSELRDQILRHRGMLLSGTAVVLAMIVVFGDLIVSALYKADYDAATWMLPILAIGVWFSALFYTVCQTLIAIGKPIYYAYSNLARFIFVTIGLYVGYEHWGVLGAVIAISLTDFWAYFVVLYGLAKERLLCLRQDLWSTGLFLGITLVLGLGRQSLGFGFPMDNLPLP